MTTLTSSTAQIQAELESIGFTTSTFSSSQGLVVCFPYEIETGTHKGEEVLVGVSFQEEGYPEYPPHWIHVSPPLNDGLGGAVHTYSTPDGREWLAMSRPPGPLWDELPTKHMNAFVNEHLRRIWRDV